MEKRLKKQLANKKYREKNKEKIRAYLKLWRSNNKEYIKKYKKANRKRFATKEKQWRINNRDKVLQSKKRWYRKYHSRILEYHRTFYQKNKDKLLPQMRAYTKRIRPIRTIYENEYRKAREKRDPTFLLGRRLRARARIAFTRRGLQRNISISNLLKV